MKKQFVSPKIRVIKAQTMSILAGSGEPQSQVRFGIHSLTTENSNESYGF